MAENKVNKPQNEEEKKKKKGFVAWWQGLKNLYKGLIIGGTVAVLATAITLPIVLTRNKGSNSGVQVTEQEWKAAFEKINPSNPSKLGNFTAQCKYSVGETTINGLVKNVNYKEWIEQTDTQKKSYFCYEENATTNDRIGYYYLPYGDYWHYEEGSKVKETYYCIVTIYSMFDESTNKYSSFKFSNNKYSANGIPSSIFELCTYNQVVEFDKDKNISKIKTDVIYEGEVAQQIECSYTDYGKTVLPDDFPKASLPKIVNLNYDETNRVFKSSPFNYKKDDLYAFRIENKQRKVDLETMKIVDSSSSILNTTFQGSNKINGQEIALDTRKENEVTFKNRIEYENDLYVYAKAGKDEENATCELSVLPVAQNITADYDSTADCYKQTINSPVSARARYKATITYSSNHNYNCFSFMKNDTTSFYDVGIKDISKTINITSIVDNTGKELLIKGDEFSLVGNKLKYVDTFDQNVTLVFTVTEEVSSDAINIKAFFEN